MRFLILISVFIVSCERECKCICDCGVKEKTSKHVEFAMDGESDKVFGGGNLRKLGSIVKDTLWMRPAIPGWYIMNNGRGWVPVYVELSEQDGCMVIVDLEGEADRCVGNTYATSWAGRMYLGDE